MLTHELYCSALNQMTKLVFTFNSKKNVDHKESCCIYPNSLYYIDKKYFFSLEKVIFKDWKQRKIQTIILYYMHNSYYFFLLP